MNVTLTEYELMQASMVGCLRYIAAIKRNYKSGTKFKAGWSEHVEGACGEVAAAKALGAYWGGSINTFKTGGDLDSTGYEVRTRSEQNYDLIIRDDDPNDRIFILVTGQTPNYEIAGWLLAADAKQVEFKKDYGGYGPAYFVPRKHLRPMRELEVAHES
jgi:hypothetical protein